jgi:hypothetical protein
MPQAEFRRAPEGVLNEFNPHIWIPEVRDIPYINHLIHGMLKDLHLVPRDFSPIIDEALTLSHENMRWEYNRNPHTEFGKRVTGEMITTTGVKLPATGFEGYYVGSHKTPQEIVTDITNKGKQLLENLPTNLLREHFLAMLEGKDVPNAHIMWTYAQQEFSSLLQSFRDMKPEIGTPERERYDKYRQSIQDIVDVAPPMKLDIAETGEYARTMYFPLHPERFGPSPLIHDPELNARVEVDAEGYMITIPQQKTVSLTDEQLNIYMRVAREIGRTGEITIRTLLKKYPDPYAYELPPVKWG